MTTLEIILIVSFAIVVSTIFFLYLFNSIKIKNKQKKEKAQKEQEKLEQEKLETQAKTTENPVEKIENTTQESPQKPQKIDVVDVEISNQTFDQINSTVAIVTEQKPETRTTLENMSREEFEAQMMEKVEPVQQEQTSSQKSMKQQIDDLSPQLKSMLFTDILKPKF